MQSIIKTSILLFVFFVAACSSDPTARDLNGKPFHLSALKGKWVVVNYWADWCKPCRAEIPELNALYKMHSKDLIVVGVNYDQLPAEQLKPIAQTMGIDYPLLTDDLAATLRKKPISVVPTTLLIAPDGILKQVLLGPQTARSLLQWM